MAQRGNVVRVSSKGQIVIPAGLRKRMGIRTGQSLVVRETGDREIVLRAIEHETASLDDMLGRFRRAAAESGRDALKEFHERRRRERIREREQRERRGS